MGEKFWKKFENVDKTRVLFSKMMSWATSFPKNKLALDWKQSELDAKRTK